MALVNSSPLSNEEIMALINSVSWYHSVEILPGIIAPGIVPQGGRAYNVEYMVDFIIKNSPDLTGKRILEIGTWDGPVAYKLKSLGYDITASDIQDPNKTGFNVIGKITKLYVPYVRCSVYELPIYFRRNFFDIVLFFGVFYHLKYPVLAFERIADILKPNGRVLFMGSGLGYYLEKLDGSPIPADNCNELRLLIEKCEELGVPLCLSYPGTFLNGDNWFLPNSKALEGWLIAAGFKVGAIYKWMQDNGALGLSGWAELVNPPVIEHGLVGEEGGYEHKLGILK